MENNADNGFLESFLSNREALARYVAQIVPANEAEDIVQATFAKIFEKGTDQIRAPRALMYTTARNLAIDHVRREGRSHIYGVDDAALSQMASDEPNQEAVAVSREELDILASAIAELPPKCREVFWLRRVDRLSYKEIAERLDISISTIEKHVIKGLAHCSRRFGKLDEPQARNGHKVNGAGDPTPAKVNNV